jgi:predicted aldo/keto reductase-like oxidoreductase
LSREVPGNTAQGPFHIGPRACRVHQSTIVSPAFRRSVFWGDRSPHVDVTLTGPASVEQLRENLAALDQGRLTADEMAMFREIGPLVKARGSSWF